MKVDVNRLDDLMRLKKISPAELAEKTGISEATIRRRLDDHDWRMKEAEILTRVLEISADSLYLYFFEPLIEQTQKEGET